MRAKLPGMLRRGTVSIIVGLIFISALGFGGWRLERRREWQVAYSLAQDRFKFAYAHRDDSGAFGNNPAWKDYQAAQKVLDSIQTSDQSELTKWGDLYECGLRLKSYRDLSDAGVPAGEYLKDASACLP